MSQRLTVAPLLSLLVTALLACSAETGPPLVATDVEITAAMPGMSMRAGYLALENNSDATIRITHVSSPQFGSVEIHETVIENDIARMRRVPELVIPAGQTLRLQRGGRHLMLKQPVDDLAQVNISLHSGESLLLTLSAHLPGND